MIVRKLLDLSKVNEESCRYSGRGALTMNNKFSEFVQGHSDALPADGASMFIEDNVAYLNNAFAGYGSDKEDNIFKKRGRGGHAARNTREKSILASIAARLGPTMSSNPSEPILYQSCYYIRVIQMRCLRFWLCFGLN